MNTTVAKPAQPTQRKSLEDVRTVMANADLKILEKAGRRSYGRVLRRAVELAGMSDKEAAVALGECVPGGEPIDAAQFSRWISGDENPQVWRFHAVPALRDALLIAEAEDAGQHVTVRTVIEMTRRVA